MPVREFIGVAAFSANAGELGFVNGILLRDVDCDGAVDDLNISVSAPIVLTDLVIF